MLWDRLASTWILGRAGGVEGLCPLELTRTAHSWISMAGLTFCSSLRLCAFESISMGMTQRRTVAKKTIPPSSSTASTSLRYHREVIYQANRQAAHPQTVTPRLYRNVLVGDLLAERLQMFSRKKCMFSD